MRSMILVLFFVFSVQSVSSPVPANVIGVHLADCRGQSLSIDFYQSTEDPRQGWAKIGRKRNEPPVLIKTRLEVGTTQFTVHTGIPGMSKIEIPWGINQTADLCKPECDTGKVKLICFSKVPSP